MSSDYIIDGNLGGYIDSFGNFIICEEFNLTDADCDRFAVDVQNGLGYYNSDGWFVRNYNFFD